MRSVWLQGETDLRERDGTVREGGQEAWKPSASLKTIVYCHFSLSSVSPLGEKKKILGRG